MTEPARNRPASPTATVLIVDDDAVLRSLLRATLSATPVGLLEAEDGAEALRLIQAYHPQVVVLDIMMPGLSGLDVLRQVRANDAIPQPHIILLTARSAARERAGGLAAGADAYLTKPFSPRQLLDAIYSALNGPP